MSSLLLYRLLSTANNTVKIGVTPTMDALRANFKGQDLKHV